MNFISRSKSFHTKQDLLQTSLIVIVIVITFCCYFYLYDNVYSVYYYVLYYVYCYYLINLYNYVALLVTLQTLTEKSIIETQFFMKIISTSI